MIRVAVCGMGKEHIARLLHETSDGAAEVTITSDFEGATALKQGNVDYFVGACQSGAGGALAVATAILGPDKAIRLSGVGSGRITPEKIKTALEDGKVAFGLAHSHVQDAVPMLATALLERARI